MGRPQSKEEYRKELADAFIHVLEEKGLDWKKEWRGCGGNAPQNGITKACYRGTNAFYLSLVAMAKGYQDPRWVTMIQIMDKDGKYHPKEKWHLKAGSKASYVEYWYPFDTKNKKALKWNEYREAVKNGRNPEDFILSTRYTAVFNADNIEGMPEMELPAENADIKPNDIINKLAFNMGVLIYFDGGDQAYYSPSKDSIHLPSIHSFESDYAFCSTALHELAHSTGHHSRLDRKQGSFFGTPDYAYEELVAEITSCFMGISSGIEQTPEHVDNHKAYVQTWVNAIREKPEALVKAVKDAQSAANYMDWKAELITEAEYSTLSGKAFEVPVREERSRDEAR